MTEENHLEIDATPEFVGKAFEAHQAREDAWLADTSVGARGEGRDMADVWGDKQSTAEPAPQPTVYDQVEEAWTAVRDTFGENIDQDELLASLGEGELADLPAAERLFALASLQAAEAHIYEGNPELGLAALGGRADLFSELTENRLDEQTADGLWGYIHRTNEEIQREQTSNVAQGVADATNEHEVLRTSRGEELLRSVLDQVALDGTRENAKQIAEMAAAAAREEERTARLQAFQDRFAANLPGRTVNEYGEVEGMYGNVIDTGPPLIPEYQKAMSDTLKPAGKPALELFAEEFARATKQTPGEWERWERSAQETTEEAVLRKAQGR